MDDAVASSSPSPERSESSDGSTGSSKENGSPTKMQVNQDDSPTQSPLSPRTTSFIMASALAERRAKRESERTLQKLLKEAQSRFDKLNIVNEQVTTENRELQAKLNVQLDGISDEKGGQVHEERETPKEAKNSAASVEDEPEEVSTNDPTTKKAAHDMKSAEKEEEMELPAKEHGEITESEDDDEEMTVVKSELRKARDIFPNLYEEYNRMKADLEHTWEQNHLSSSRVGQLEAELESAKHELDHAKNVELTLKKSLREALGLLQPLQAHLETSEREKVLLERKVRKYKGKWNAHKHRRFSCGTAGSNADDTASVDTEMLTGASIHSSNDILETPPGRRAEC